MSTFVKRKINGPQMMLAMTWGPTVECMSTRDHKVSSERKM